MKIFIDYILNNVLLIWNERENNHSKLGQNKFLDESVFLITSTNFKSECT